MIYDTRKRVAVPRNGVVFWIDPALLEHACQMQAHLDKTQSKGPWRGKYTPFQWILERLTPKMELVHDQVCKLVYNAIAENVPSPEAHSEEVLKLATRVFILHDLEQEPSVDTLIDTPTS